MKKKTRVWVLAMFVTLAFATVQSAQERARMRELRGVFVRLVEQAVGDHEYVGMVVKPFDSDEHVTVLVPREPREVTGAARRLKEGQEMEIAFVTEEGHPWLTALHTQGLVVRLGGGEQRVEIEERSDEPGRRVEVRETRRVERRPERVRSERPGREPMRGLAGQLERLADEFRRLAERVRQMEGEMRRLREENERLRRSLRERGSREEGRERRETEQRTEGRERRGPMEMEIPVMLDRGERRQVRPPLPDAMAGFRGVLLGRIQRKLDRGFVLKVENVGEVWADNDANNPEAAVGKELMITIRADPGGERFARTLRGLEIGRKVLVEAFHFGGNQLTVVEQLRAVD
ncbi:MAG: hypothetical protein JSU70_08780 [Phycisphaerales bacterium]|nr:MAG: hypothetical protein JSU70_08780 [Phycisphaerales bacterium]